MPESSYRPPAIQGPSGGHSSYQGSSSAHSSSTPESSYHPPSIQGSSSGYPGQQAQTSGYQAPVPRGCYECGDPGHIKRTCPRLRGKAVQQGQQSMDPAPAAQPSRGGRQTGRGRPRGGGQTGRGQPATTQTGGGQTADRIYRSCVGYFLRLRD
ncbi:PREDICTED: DNA-binding protein HEXBP-like [Nicotiana attenuata]|uniref:DNA-binding protein HEXBP-like n=1 Tax=Nicotiana attenuata TaxID=49451 RepID=UPI000904D0D0|nr:PREDICTED: DNA-binding protein HEXBP-like [Nicotiana attenuata]